MNTYMIKRLVLKDWYFQRWPLAAYLAGGIIGVALLAAGTTASFYAATVVLITVLVTAGVSLAVTTVVNERSEHTLPFVMSLPISPSEYTTAKVIANLTIFLLPWSALTILTLGLLSMGGAGLIPLATLTLVELFASYCLILMVAIVTESQGWTIAVMGASNLFLQGFLFYVARMPGIAKSTKGKVALWDRAAITVLVVEIVLSVLFIALAFVLQQRKKDFL